MWPVQYDAWNDTRLRFCLWPFVCRRFFARERRAEKTEGDCSLRVRRRKKFPNVAVRFHSGRDIRANVNSFSPNGTFPVVPDEKKKTPNPRQKRVFSATETGQFITSFTEPCSSHARTIMQHFIVYHSHRAELALTNSFNDHPDAQNILIAVLIFCENT